MRFAQTAATVAPLHRRVTIEYLAYVLQSLGRWVGLPVFLVVDTRNSMRYTSSITSGSLRLPESRAVAAVMLENPEEPAFRQAIAGDNVLQAKSAVTRQNLGAYLRRRLTHLPPALLDLVRDGSQLEATQACLAGAIMDSPLLGDFLDLALRPLYRTYKTHLPAAEWSSYLDGCHSRDPDMPCWTESTCNRLRSSVFKTLAEAGFINNTRERRLQAVHLVAPITRELTLSDDLGRYALRCMEVAA